MLPGAAGQGGVAAREVDEVVEVGALEAERPLLFHHQETAAAQLVAAFRACGVADDGEDDEVLGGWGSGWYRLHTDKMPPREARRKGGLAQFDDALAGFDTLDEPRPSRVECVQQLLLTAVSNTDPDQGQG
jgi:hypothetical protein